MNALAKKEDAVEGAPHSQEALDELIDAWIVQVKSRTGSERTSREYLRILNLFLDDLPRRDIREATLADALAFAYRGNPGASSVKVRLATLRSFCRFCQNLKLPIDDITIGIKRPVAPQPIPRGLSTEEAKALLGEIMRMPINGRRAARLRDYAITLTALLMGLRIREILGIRKRDLTRNGAIYLSWKAKGGVLRRRELPEPAWEAINRYITTSGRDLERMGEEEPLFNCSYIVFFQNLKRYARAIRRRTGTDILGIHPHSLRHTAACLRFENGATVADIQSQLGHKSATTTNIYLQRLAGERDRGWAEVARELEV